MLAALRRHVEAWYRQAYGEVAPHRGMIDHYSLGTPERARLLLGPVHASLTQAPPARVLDVGCGFASIPTYLAWLWPQAEIVATDMRDDYYRAGRMTAEELAIGNIAFRTEPINELEEREAFDLVLSSNMLNFMTSRAMLQDAVRRLWDATRPGGHLCLYTPHFGSLREPFTRIPLLHALPARWQDRLVRALKKRSTLLDVRNPSIREINAVLLPRRAQWLGVYPGSALRRMRSTHVMLWYRK